MEELADDSGGDPMAKGGAGGAAASGCAAVAPEVETREDRGDEDRVDDGKRPVSRG